MTSWMTALWRARASAALVVLRCAVGFGFAAHGVAKITKGPEHFATILDAMGIPLPHAAAWATSLLELVGGVALMLGLWVPQLAAPLAVVMLTAMFGVHWRYGFSSIRLLALTPSGAQFGPVGYELNLLYLAALGVLAVARPSPLSLDELLASRARRRDQGGS